MRKQYLLLLFLLISTVSFAQKTITEFTLSEETAPFSNPHKGFVQYPYDSKYFTDETFGVEANETWDFISTVYLRFHWNKIETAYNVFDWSPIDKMIELSKAQGKTFAFGIIPADSGWENEKKGLVPEYVWDNGCTYVNTKVTGYSGKKGKIRTPVWSDEQYVDAAIHLAQAIAAKYDGDSDIEFIDIRSLGNWGEWHTWGLDGSKMPSDEIQKRILDGWRACFKKTQLVLPVNGDKPTEVSKYAVSLGISLRRDGLVTLENHEQALVPAADAQLPTVGEFCDSYEYMKKHQTWKDETMIKIITTAKLSYLAMGANIPDGKRMYDENKNSVAKYQNMLGYNFVVQQASLVTDSESSAAPKYTLAVTVANKGVAPQYFTVLMRLLFIDEKGKVINKLADEHVLSKGEFSAGTTRDFSFSFSENDFPANSFIALGLFEDEDDETPSVRFGNTNTTVNRMLVLGSSLYDEQ